MFKGFTLIEVLIVILIVGILASLAMPQYTKLVEKAKVSEAKTMLSAIRTAEGIYFSEKDEYTEDLEDDLDVEVTTAKFSYAVTAENDAVPQTFKATATRIGGSYQDDTISMDQDGNITATGKYVDLLGIE
ncbi:prepilin-type N-terminal cleavage/methylation domain-containing protein [bacterium]|nr:prepilin-type N-terminal cleavage/methylation domain-containing protein [bacterium]